MMQLLHDLVVGLARPRKKYLRREYDGGYRLPTPRIFRHGPDGHIVIRVHDEARFRRDVEEGKHVARCYGSDERLFGIHVLGLGVGQRYRVNGTRRRHNDATVELPAVCAAVAQIYEWLIAVALPKYLRLIGRHQLALQLRRKGSTNPIVRRVVAR